MAFALSSMTVLLSKGTGTLSGEAGAGGVAAGAGRLGEAGPYSVAQPPRVRANPMASKARCNDDTQLIIAAGASVVAKAAPPPIASLDEVNLCSAMRV